MDKLENGLNEKLEQAEVKNEVRHQQLVEQVKQLEIDQDYIFEKTVRNERELANLKRRLV